MLLRLGVGIALIFLAMSALLRTLGEPITVVPWLIAAVGGISLLAGLWTPVMGALIAIDELWIAASLYSSGRDVYWIHIFLATLTAGVAMVGPGAWSIDAHLFGRKRFDIGDRPRDRKPSR